MSHRAPQTSGLVFRSTSRQSFPTTWFCDAERYPEAMKHLEVSGLTVKYGGPGVFSHHATAIRADHSVPLDCPLYYFEIIVVANGGKAEIGVGLSGDDVRLERLPGWEPESYGYHGDDGKMFRGHGTGIPFGPTFATDDVVGCYWNRAERVIGFTKNGIDLGVAFKDVTERVLHPTVGMQTPEAEIKANFGASQFVADVNGMWVEQAQRVRSNLYGKQLKAAESLSSVIMKLILDYAVHHRCPKTAAAVSSELSEDRATSVADEKDIYDRQRIYDTVMSGNIDEALSQTEAVAPGTLEKHPKILFRLRCLKFVEMVQNPEEDVHAALQFGRTFLTPSCSGPDDEQLLAEVLSLIAYKHPSQSPCNYLLQTEYKKELADALNGAILESQGRRTRPMLETIYRQLFAAFDELEAIGELDCHFVDFRKLLFDGLSSRE